MDDIDKAFSVLEAYGVPRGRAGSVHNGIEVLATRFGKEIYFLRAALENSEPKPASTNSASNPLALCCKNVMVVCQEFDPANGSCQKCNIRPTACE